MYPHKTHAAISSVNLSLFSSIHNYRLHIIRCIVIFTTRIVFCSKV